MSGTDFHPREVSGSDRGGHCPLQRHILKLLLLGFFFMAFVWTFLMTIYVLKRLHELGKVDIYN